MKARGGGAVRCNYRVRWHSVMLALLTLLYFPYSRLLVASDIKPNLNYCSEQQAQIVAVEGIAEVLRSGERAWKRIVIGDGLCAGDMLRVRVHSRVALRQKNESMLRLGEKTTVTFAQSEVNSAQRKATLLELLQGVLHVITRTPEPFEIRTPFMNAGVDGTEFSVAVESDKTHVVVYEGQVTASNDQGSIVLVDQEAGIAYKDQKPQKEVIVRSLDAVQWALYYPAIIDPRVIEQQLPQTLQATVRESLEHYRQGNAFEALAALEALDRNTLGAQLLTYRAGLYLTLGRVAEARHDIAQALQLQPNDSEAYALQAIIAVVQNDKAAALQLAEQAINADRTSPTARLALSYAYQAHFQIEEALGSVEEALRLDGKNALVWARLSELQMSTGYLDRALESAQQAVSLNPNLGKTQTVLGFAHLLRIDTTKAKATFAKAIQLDQADPMPRLGLGLALIREGQLEAGRIELEIAASLDPANSLVRSYLGKAYFEEKRYGLAETQFDLAKARDPNDPTPWFYDAIQKQTQNRPVEALRDIQKSIELNNNRAVYRSKLLLDKDEAARGSSLARIYDNLGFEKRAIMETAKSLSHDPANHSAHRFLADAYVNIPRHEVARVSELLQAQLLQPINVNPVQPRLAVADLNIITGTGPAALGFNEFAPLTERNKPQVVASGLYGSNSTLGNEVVASAVYDKASISVGQFHYDTKGFRQNNDQNHNVYNAFMQYALTPKLNVQTELRHRDTEHGQLLLDFDRDSPDPNVAKSPLNPNNHFRRAIDEDTARIGARYAITPHQDFIVSTSFADKKEGGKQFGIASLENQPLLQIPINAFHTERNHVYQVESQYQYRDQRFNLIAGGGIYRVNSEINLAIKLLPPNDPSILCIVNPAICYSQDLNKEKINGYLYTNYNLRSNLNATIGMSYDAHQNPAGPANDYGRFNPKFGLQWDIVSNIRLRLAWFETTKSALVANQTIEPTQIAGFNQLYDDLAGTKSRRMGIGIDTHYANTIFGGIEISQRELEVPLLFSTKAKTFFQSHKENLYRSYLYWPINNQWVLRGEGQFERFSRERIVQDQTVDPLMPHQIDTLSAPLSLSYFGAQGLFSSLIGTYVNQKIDRETASPIYEGSSRLNIGKEGFFLVDAVLGFRLPNRRGILSFEARNLLDEQFLYRNANFYLSEPTLPRFLPARTLFLRATLNF